MRRGHSAPLILHRTVRPSQATALVIMWVTASLLVAGCAAATSDGDIGEIVISGDVLTIEPTTVTSESIKFEVVGSHPGFAFVSLGNQRRPEPLTDDYIERMERGAFRPGGFIRAGLVGKGSIVDFSGYLPDGKYAFVLLDEDAGPSTAPLALVVFVVES